jgi:sec-independent protein translocase protein TatC
MNPDASMDSVAAPAAGSVPRRFRPRWLRLPLPRRNRPPQAPEPNRGEMTLTGHLVELRNRLFIAAFSLLPGTVIGFIFANPIIHVLKAPLPTDKPLVALGLTEPFMIQLQVALVVGVILAMPVILYEFWAYVSPGLSDRERSAARPWVPAALFFFAVGVGVAYFILPYASGFLYGFQTSDVTLMLTADAYFGFVTTLFLAFGLVMEFPIFLVLLSKMGIVTSQRLRNSRRMAVLGITIFSALITPGADLVSPIVMAVTMYTLYEASIVMIRLGGR